MLDVGDVLAHSCGLYTTVISSNAFLSNNSNPRFPQKPQFGSTDLLFTVSGAARFRLSDGSCLLLCCVRREAQFG